MGNIECFERNEEEYSESLRKDKDRLQRKRTKNHKKVKSSPKATEGSTGEEDHGAHVNPSLQERRRSSTSSSAPLYDLGTDKAFCANVAHLTVNMSAKSLPPDAFGRRRSPSVTLTPGTIEYEQSSKQLKQIITQRSSTVLTMKKVVLEKYQTSTFQMDLDEEDEDATSFIMSPQSDYYDSESDMDPEELQEIERRKKELLLRQNEDSEKVEMMKALNPDLCGKTSLFRNESDEQWTGDLVEQEKRAMQEEMAELCFVAQKSMPVDVLPFTLAVDTSTPGLPNSSMKSVVPIDLSVMMKLDQLTPNESYESSSDSGTGDKMECYRESMVTHQPLDRRET